MIKNIFLLPIAATRHILGDNIRCSRNKLHWSQGQLGIKCGLHQDYIGRLERGNQNVGIDNVTKIALVLGVEIPTLFIKDACFEQITGNYIPVRAE
jgi:transcriptional regulator with XRE-family HTH domain